MGDQDFPLERSWYIGNTIFAILYGVELTMFFMSSYFLWIGSKRDKSRYIYIAYSATLLVLITIAMACNLWFGQEMWIEHRDVDGGPVAFFGANIAAWYNTFGTAADVTANVLGDGLMLYRCYVFWGSTSLWTVAFPALLFLASTSMGIVTTIQSGVPGGDFFHGVTVNFTVPWLVLTITFNVITTTMITYRLLVISRSMRNVLAKERADVYIGVIAILIESALPFTLLGIAYLITYIRQDPESLAFADIWGCFVSLSPQAIILRVAMGSAWSKKTVTQYGSTTHGTAVVFGNSSQGTALQTFRKESLVGSGNNSTRAVTLNSKKSNLESFENFQDV
ncbi:hypothetical protein C8F04DRAFT_996625 [Mycena alexandri]|uniref:Uncharacterized protein n=1 Tax=Mycena alexandri TaxID=1745969 RepID=A0AAD6T4E0_9AGAR|nr:hypothetical protein C8F04DRAFT_996625 [Mycena alexandri]